MCTDCWALTIKRETFSTGDGVTDWPRNCNRQDHDEQIKWNTSGDILHKCFTHTRTHAHSHTHINTHTNTLTCSIAHPLTRTHIHPPVAQMHTVSWLKHPPSHARTRTRTHTSLLLCLPIGYLDGTNSLHCPWANYWEGWGVIYHFWQL